MHVLLLSATRGQVGGADRDCIALINSSSGLDLRLSWAGIWGTESLRPHVSEHVRPRFLDLGHPLFTYTVQDNLYQARSFSQWTRILTDHALRSAKPLWRLCWALRTDPPDVVLTNSACVSLGAVYARCLSRSHVWLVKECLDVSYESAQRHARWIERAGSAVVVPSRAAARAFQRNVHVLPDGNEIEKIDRNSSVRSREDVLLGLGLEPESLVIAQVGGFSRFKGQHVLAEAWMKLPEDDRGRSSLLFLGSGNWEWEVRQRLPPDSLRTVRFKAFAPMDFSYLAAADIVAHPSTLPDPYPNAVREAMILGKPVVASATGGITEMIEDRKSGLLIAPNDASGLAEALQALLRSKDLRARLGQAAKQRARVLFDARTCSEPQWALIRSLVGLPPSAPP